MKMHQPIGNSLYAPFFVRVALGLYCILLARTRIENIPGFIEEIKALNVVSNQVAMVYGTLVPYLGLGGGVLLVLGMWTTLGAIVVSAIICSILFALNAFPKTFQLFDLRLILLACALSLMYSGAGALSIDNFRKEG